MKVVKLEAGHEAYRMGKPRKRVHAPRAVDHGYLKAAPPSNDSPKRGPTKGHEEFKERNLALIVQDDPSVLTPAPELYQAKVVEGAQAGLDPVKRAQYAALETRKEIVAIQLAQGATFIEAGDAAGVSADTASRYYAEREVRARVDEMREVVRNKVGGRIEAWMDRYTEDPNELDKKDPKTILAIHDRVTGPVGRAAPAHVEQNNLTVNDYSGFMGRLAGIARQSPAETALPVDDSRKESRGIPVLGADGS